MCNGILRVQYQFSTYILHGFNRKRFCVYQTGTGIVFFHADEQQVELCSEEHILEKLYYCLYFVQRIFRVLYRYASIFDIIHISSINTAVL